MNKTNLLELLSIITLLDSAVIVTVGIINDSIIILIVGIGVFIAGIMMSILDKVNRIATEIEEQR